MSKFAKLSIGATITLVVVLIAGYIFLHHLVTKSFPVTSGIITSSGLHNPVDIYRDKFGVPHISAHDEHDLMYATGYVQAQDRLWQMDMARRIGQGRLSEVLDTATIKIDKLFRTLQFSSMADSLAKHIHPNSRRLLEDYAEGVNEFISTHKGKYPVEFDMLNYEPEPWTVQHSLIIGRLMAWELCFAWWVDLTYAEIAKLVSEEKFKDITLSDQEITQQKNPRLQSEVLPVDIHQFLSEVKDYRYYFNIGSFSSASNAWVIDSSKSMTGKPILANDPHLLISLPSKWYELHLATTGWNVSGVSIPGVPFVIIGQNDSLAWGFTNAMLDDADFYLEEVDSLKPNYYHYKNSILPMHVREEVIRVGKSDSLEFIVRSTHHGPIITDVHPAFTYPDNNSIQKRSIISLKWTGFGMSDEILGFYRIDRARNKIEFEEGLKKLTVPGQCVTYADVNGNIGLWTAGLVPIRGKHNGAELLAGNSGDDEWQGFVPFEKLPHIWNPAEGVIISANHQFVDKSYPYYLSTLWEPWSRYDRIKDLLSLEKISPQDFQQFQQDIVSYYSRDLTQEILQTFGDDTIADPEVSASLVYLRNWNYRCTPTDIASTIVNTFFVRLVHNIYEDEMGPDVFHDFVYALPVPYRVTQQLLQKENSSWFDDVRTDTVETKSMVVKKSFLDAIGELRNKFGTETKTWQWGKLHQVIFEHPFGKRKPLDKVVNVGPFPIGGGEQTINKGAFKLTDPFKLLAAPSMRQIVDLADPEHGYRILTLGQSGQPMHDHYDDQMSLWLNGGYRQTTIDWDEIKNQNMEHLVLKPK